MFSFVKWLKQFISNLKQKKGLWFTLITTFAVVGIILSMTLLMSMTTSVANDVYVNMSKSYNKMFNTCMSIKNNHYKQVSATITSDLTLLDNMAKGNTTATNALLKIYNDNFVKNGMKEFEVLFYSTANQLNQYRNAVNAVLNSKNSLYGLEVLPEGIYIVSIEPVYNNDVFVGALELREPLYNLKETFDGVPREYIVSISGGARTRKINEPVFLEFDVVEV